MRFPLYLSPPTPGDCPPEFDVVPTLYFTVVFFHMLLKLHINYMYNIHIYNLHSSAFCFSLSVIMIFIYKDNHTPQNLYDITHVHPMGTLQSTYPLVK